MNFISNLINIISDPEIRIFVIIILAFFTINLYFLLNGYGKINRDLKETLRKIKNLSFFNRSEASNRNNFTELDYILDKSATLSHPWSEFKESLVSEIEEFELNNSKVTIEKLKNAEEASNYFNYDDVVINSPVWKFGIKHGVFETIPNILTGLGILCTFIGIVVSLPSNLDGEMTKKINDFIGGMRIAFGASIVGLSCAILFNFLEKWLHDMLEHKINEVSNTIDFLFVKKSEQEYLYSIEGELKNSSNAIYLMSNSIGQNVAQGFQSLGVSSEAINESLKRGVENGLKNMTSELDSLVTKQIQLNSANNEILSSITEVKNILNSTKESLSLQANNINEASSGLMNIATTFSEINKEIIPKFESSMNIAREVSIFAGQSDQVLMKLLNEKDIIFKQFEEMNTNLKDSYNQLTKAFEEYQKRSNSAVDIGLTSFDKELANGVRRLSSVILDLSNVGEDIKKIHENIHDNFKEMIRENS